MKLFIALLFALPTLVFAQSSCTNTIGTAVIYTNGVDTSKPEATTTLLNLKNRTFTPDELNKIDPKKVDFVLAHNSSFKESTDASGGKYLDLLETYYQKTQEAGIPERDAWKNFHQYKSQYFLPLLAYDPTGYIMRPFIESYIEYSSEDIGQSRRDTIDQIIGHWKTRLDAQYRVLALSHSQGGLFVNEVYNEIKNTLSPDKEKAIRIFRIATPAGTLLGRGSYKNYANDFVIKFLANTLLANVKFSLLDNLINSYLSSLANPFLWYLYLSSDLFLLQKTSQTNWFHSIDNFYLSNNYPELRNEIKQAILDEAKSSCGDFDILKEVFALDPQLIKFTATTPSPFGGPPQILYGNFTWYKILKDSQGSVVSTTKLGETTSPYLWIRGEANEEGSILAEVENGSTFKSSETSYHLEASSVCDGEDGWYHNLDKFSPFGPGSTYAGGFVSSSSTVAPYIDLSGDSQVCQGSNISGHASINSSKIYESNLRFVLVNYSYIRSSNILASLIGFATLENVTAQNCDISGYHSSDSCDGNIWSSSSNLLLP